MAEYNSGNVHVNRTPYVTFKDRHGGLQFMVRNDNECGRHMIEHGIFEYGLIEWCKQLLSKERSFVDIGSHIGTWSMYLSSLCKTVHAFEAQRMTYFALNGSIALNGFQNIQTYNVALGSPKSEGEEMDLKIVSLDGGGSTLMKEAAQQVGYDFGSERVVVRSLDSFNLVEVGLMKVDVEGWELEVLKGSVKTIERCQPKIVFECWPDSWYEDKRKSLFDFITSVGYRIIPIGGVNNMYLAEPQPKEK